MRIYDRESPEIRLLREREKKNNRETNLKNLFPSFTVFNRFAASQLSTTAHTHREYTERLHIEFVLPSQEESRAAHTLFPSKQYIEREYVRRVQLSFSSHCSVHDLFAPSFDLSFSGPAESLLFAFCSPLPPPLLLLPLLSLLLSLISLKHQEERSRSSSR